MKEDDNFSRNQKARACDDFVAQSSKREREGGVVWLDANWGREKNEEVDGGRRGENPDYESVQIVTLNKQTVRHSLFYTDDFSSFWSSIRK